MTVSTLKLYIRIPMCPPMVRVEIRIALKHGVADPEGASTKKALELLGFAGVGEVAAEKLFEVVLDEKDEEAAVALADDMCRRLLANPVIHDYSIRVVG